MKKQMPGYKLFYSPLPFDTPQLRLRGVGWREPMPPSLIDRPRGTGDWLIMFFYDPVTVGGMNGEDRRHLPQGGLVLWAPGEWQYYGNVDQSYVHTWVHCDGTLVRQGLMAAGLGSGIWPGTATLCEKLVGELHAEASELEPDAQLAGACVTVFIRRLARLAGKLAGAGVPSRLLALKRQLEARPQDFLTLDEMCAVACLSRSHLCVQFKRWFGRPPLDYQIEQRMTLAQYLLHDCNLRIGEIARRVGYEDIYYFSKLFKKRLGVCPEAFRKTLR